MAKGWVMCVCVCVCEGGAGDELIVIGVLATRGV